MTDAEKLRAGIHAHAAQSEIKGCARRNKDSVFFAAVASK